MLFAANPHNSQTVAALLVSDKTADIVYADSGCARQHIEELLAAVGVDRRIHEFGNGNRPLDEEGQTRNNVNSMIRASFAHCFGQMHGSMCGTLIRRFGLSRTNALRDLTNLKVNLLRFSQKLRVRFVPG
jgi:hypothetical protein